MRILYIANVRLPTEKAHGVQIMKSCEAFVSAGHDITLIVPNRRSPIESDTFDYYKIKKRFPLKRLFTIDTIGYGSVGYIFQSVLFGIVAWYYIRNHSADVIYGRDEIPLFVIGLLTRKKVVWESHDGAWNVWARYLVRRAAGVVVVTAGAVDFYVRHGVPREKLLAVSNGIDLGDFAVPETKEEARARLGLPQNKKIALYIGRLDGWKGADTLMEASRLLPSDTCVAIIGGEEKQIAVLKNKHPAVIFLGYRPYAELPNNQAAADILVVPNTAKDLRSVMFTSPLKLIAHMASERPIVVSDLPSTRFLADGAALFVTPDNPQAIAQGIQDLLNDTARTKNLVDSARRRVIDFSWSKRAEMIRNFIGLLKTVVADCTTKEI